MGICLNCIILIFVSTIVGGLLMFLFSRSHYKSVIDERNNFMAEAKLNSDNLGKVTHEYNEYKSTATDKIKKGDIEINRLNKLNMSLSKSPKPKFSQAELDHKFIKWKKRAEDLSNELEYLKAKVHKEKPDNSDVNVEKLDDLKSQLKIALKKIRKQEIQISDSESRLTLASEKKNTDKKKIKKLKEKIIKLKSKRKKK